MPPKKLAADGAPKARKSRALKQRPPGISNAEWAADVERRRNETRSRAEREKKCNGKRVAAAAEEQARLISINFGHPRIAQFPGTWPTQGMVGSPSFSLASPATAMFHDTYAAAGMAGFTPSPPAYDGAMYEGISPALRRGPLPFSNPGMPLPNEPVMHEMITSGSMAAASSPSFTQEEARATEVVASRGGFNFNLDQGDHHAENGSTQYVDEEDEQTYVDQDVDEEEAPEATEAPSKGKKKRRKKNSLPAEPRIKMDELDADATPDAAPDAVAQDGTADERVIV